MIWTRSLSVSLAVMFGLATALGSLVASVGFFVQQSAEFSRHSQQELRGRYVIVERMAAYNEDQTGWKRLTDKFADFTAFDPDLRFIVDSADPRYRFGPSPAEQAQFARALDGDGTVRIDGRTYSTFAGTIRANGQRPDVRLIIGLDQRPLREARVALALGIVGTSLLTIVVVSALGWWIARRALAPVDRLSAHSRRLGEGDLTLRLPTQGLASELAGLVLSFNGALDRLQRSHQKLSDFTADVAHELRTPLTNLIGETELALSRERSLGDLTRVLRSNLEDLDRLRSIISDMLFLARADAGDLVSNLVLVDLEAECARTVEFMEVLFEEKDTTVVIEGRAQCWVERALFGRAVANLLDNTLRHGTPGGQVVVSVQALDNEVAVWVTNQGPSIPPAALPRIFDRFYCADPSRRSNGQTHGLGLAIVEAVAKMHGGTVSVANGPGKVSVGFTLARRRDASSPARDDQQRAVLRARSTTSPDRETAPDSSWSSDRSRPG
jgi:two-component system heavy metal sensor histidine kinase CusS